MKKLIAALTLLLLSYASFGQPNSPASAADSIRGYFNRLFGSIGRARIPTGILIDRGMELLDAQRFSCRRQDTASSTVFLSLFTELQNGRFSDATNLSFSRALRDSVSALLFPETVPVGVLFARYDRIRPETRSEAIPPFLEDTVGKRLLDNPLYVGNPYRTDTCLVVSPVVSRINMGLTRFVLQPAWFVSNIAGAAALTIQADFGDGLGFRALLPGVPVSVAYNSPGRKTVQFRIMNGVQPPVLTRSVLTVTEETNRTVALNARTAAAGGLFEPFHCSNSDWMAIWKDRYSSCEAYVKYANGQYFTRPVILAEGFDALNDFGCEKLWKFVFSIANDPVNTSLESFSNALQSRGYDIVVLNFFNRGGASIESNAETMRRLIYDINDQKRVNNIPYGNVIGGISMGALVSRLAISLMERDCQDPQADLYVSYDGPHRGVNINPGTQELVYLGHSFPQFANGGAELEEQYHALFSDAARELCVARTSEDGSADPLHTQLYDLLNSYSYNKLPCRTLGISLGEPGVGAPGPTETDPNNPYRNVPFSAGDEFLSAGQSTSGGIDYSLHLYTAKPGGSADMYNIVLNYGHGLDQIIRHPQHLTQPYDNAPGSQWGLPFRVAEGVGRNATTFGRNYITLVPALSALNAKATTGNQNDVFATSYIQSFFDRTLTHKGWNVHENLAVTYQARDAILDEIDRFKTRVATNLQLDGQRFNFGSPMFNEVNRDVSIRNGSELLVNAGLPTGLLGPQQGPNPVTTDYQLRVRKGDCRQHIPHVTVNNSVFQLGDASGRIGQASFSDETSLTLESGALLRIYDHCTLTIERGATLTLLDGASLSLVGPDAKLVIKGKLVIGEHATLRYSGVGQIVFSSGSDPFSVDMQDDSKLSLIGTASEPKHIVVDQPALSLGGPVELEHCLVELGGQCRLTLDNGFRLHECDITSNTVTNGFHAYNGHLGLQVGSKLNSSITDCRFSAGQVGLFLLRPENTPHNSTVVTPFQLERCRFTGNDKGLHVLGGSIYASSLDFSDNHTGIHLEAINFLSTLNNIVIDNSSLHFRGIIVSGLDQDPGYLSLSNSHIRGCNTGVDVTGAYFNPFCSRIRENLNGIQLRAGAKLDMRGDLLYGASGGAHFPNICAANNISINNEYSEALLLRNGGNNLVPTGVNIHGALQGTIRVNTCPPPTQDVTGNSWNPNGNFTAADHYLFTRSCSVVSKQRVPAVDNAPVVIPVTQQCAITGVDCAYDPVSCLIPIAPPVVIGHGPLCARCPILNTEHFDGVRLDVALRSAEHSFQAGANGQDYRLGLEMLKEIMTAPVPADDPVTQEYLQKGTTLMEFGFAQGLASGRISADPARNQAETKLMIDAEDRLLASALQDASTDYSGRLHYSMKKVHTYTVSKNYDEALAALSQIRNWADDSDKVRVGRIACIVQLYQALDKGMVKPYEAQQYLERCNYDFLRQRPAGPEQMIASVAEASLAAPVLYPNPVSDALHIRMPEAVPGPARVEILDLAGRTVYMETLAPGRQELATGPLHLVSGLYLLRLHVQERDYLFRFNLVR